MSLKACKREFLAVFTGLAENSERNAGSPMRERWGGFAYDQLPHFTGHRRTAQAN